MGKKAAKPAPDSPTVKAVLAYAQQLRDQAERYARRHPGEGDLYAPSEAAARKVSQQLGPEQALHELRVRARAREMQLEEQQARAKAARREHHVHQSAAQRVRRELAAVSSVTLGQRLDAALRGLDVLSETPAVRLDAEPVSGSKPGSGGLPMRRQRERDVLAEDAQRIVARLERELDWSRRRLVEEDVDAA